MIIAKRNIAVIGGHKCSRQTYAIARRTGQLIASCGWALVCGGGPGVMEAACRGAKEKGGLTIGILPSYDGKEANNYLDIRLTTGLGYARNILIIRSCEAVIAIDGEYGTLSEIAFAFFAEGPRLRPPRQAFGETGREASGPARIENSGGGDDHKPIVGIKTWEVSGLKQVAGPQEAIRYLKRKLSAKEKNAK
jgi:uncharacterized protein (TIGR00725 family)